MVLYYKELSPRPYQPKESTANCLLDCCSIDRMILKGGTAMDQILKKALKERELSQKEFAELIVIVQVSEYRHRITVSRFQSV